MDGVCGPSTGNTCDDGDACTQIDTCQAGACTGASPVTCAALDQCHDAGTCDPSAGTCSNPAKPDGTACDDGDPTTKNDACHAGVCQGITCVSLVRGSGAAVEDTYIHVANPAQNFGGATELPVGASSQILLRFDPSPIPAAVTIVQATLQVRTQQIGGAVNVHEVLAPWTEMAVTWASFGGAFAPTIIGSYTATTGFHAMDVLPTVQAWYAGSARERRLLARIERLQLHLQQRGRGQPAHAPGLLPALIRADPPVDAIGVISSLLLTADERSRPPLA